MELGFGTIDLEPGRERPNSIPLTAVSGAIVIPMLVAACLIPLRGELAHSAGVILVLPVIAFGFAYGAGPGSIAAVSAALGFDLFLLPPYLSPEIYRTEDVVAALTLLLVGATAGLVGSRLVRMDRRSAERLRELSILEDHSEMLTGSLFSDHPDDADTVIGATAKNLTRLLQLESCRWEPITEWDPTSTIGQPTMLENGQIIGRLSDLPQDRAQLPNPVELVLAGEGEPLGRFLMVPHGSRTSIEERRLAATLCRLTAAHLTREEYR